MPCRHRREAVVLRPRAEHPELDLAVAHDVGVRRQPAGVAVEQIGDDLGAILPHEVDHLELDAKPVGDGARIHDVLLPGAVADDVVLVDPVLYVRARDVMTLPLEQERGDGAVDAAGQGDEDFFTGGHEAPTTRAGGGLSNERGPPASRHLHKDPLEIVARVGVNWSMFLRALRRKKIPALLLMLTGLVVTPASRAAGDGGSELKLVII